MLELRIKPELLSYESCAAFVAAHDFTPEDVILTRSSIQDAFLERFRLPSRLILQNSYGAGEPSDLMAEAILRDFNARPCRRIFAIGGGTVIDIAKVLAVSDGTLSVDEMYADMPALRARHELIIVPTTCGTGSEVTNIAILHRTGLGTKMGLVSDGMYASRAVLVPELLSRLPYQVFATSSLDALVHAVESALSGKATPSTLLFSMRALEMLVGGYMDIRARGPEARQTLLGDFLLASAYAGIAFGTAGCAAVHALSYPLGGVFHVPHGEANYSLFLEVLRAYAETGVRAPLRRVLEALARVLSCPPDRALEELAALLEAILPLKRLRDYGMTEKELREFPPMVLAAQQRLLANNYAPLSEERIRAIYTARW